MNTSDLISAMSNHPNICLFVKNYRGRYLYCNEQMAEVAGLDSPNQIFGKTDKNLIWSEQADTYERGDLLVLSGRNYSLKREKQNQKSGTVQVISSKTCLVDATGYPMGVAGCYWRHDETRIGENNIEWTTDRKTLLIDSPPLRAVLSRREAMALYLIILGYSVRVVGSILQISENTAFFHFKQLKRKLKSPSKTDLLKKCFISGVGEGLHAEFSEEFGITI